MTGTPEPPAGSPPKTGETPGNPSADWERPDPPCPFCENLDSDHGPNGECPDCVDDYRSGLTTGGCNGPNGTWS